MAAQFVSYNQCAGCCGSSAVACTSARICTRLDTVIVAVSIFVRRISLLVRRTKQ